MDAASRVRFAAWAERCPDRKPTATPVRGLGRHCVTRTHAIMGLARPARAHKRVGRFGRRSSTRLPRGEEFTWSKYAAAKSRWRRFAPHFFVGVPAFRRSPCRGSEDDGDRAALAASRKTCPGAFRYTAGCVRVQARQRKTRRGCSPAKAHAVSHQQALSSCLSAHSAEAKRLSTAFDSVTLVRLRPCGASGYLRQRSEQTPGVCDRSPWTIAEGTVRRASTCAMSRATSVSMTINGPAPTILAMFLNTAIRQQCRRYLRSKFRLDITEAAPLQPDALRDARWRDVRAMLDDETYRGVRRRCTVPGSRHGPGPISSRRTKGQNTCIFSTEFSPAYDGRHRRSISSHHNVRNFYSVSISAVITSRKPAPIRSTQLALTLSNGFTYVEYISRRGVMHVR